MEPYVLIVDDLGMVRETARHFLRYTPMEVMTAADGVDALRQVRERKPSLVVADILMPRMNGLQLCAALKEDRELGGVPVLLMLNPDDPDQLEAASLVKADALIAKPLDRREFLEKGRKFLPSIDRREPRVPCAMPVSYEGEGFSGTATSLDISVGGVYLITPDPVPRETVLSLSFTLPPGEGRRFSTSGRVAWVNHPAGGEQVNPHLPAGFGVEFVGCSDVVKFYLRRFVESQRS